MLRDLALKALAIVVIAFAGMASSAWAGQPDEPCTSENYGESVCEGCDYCYAVGDPFRLSEWTCTAQYGWEEEYFGYSNYDDCELHLVMCGTGGGGEN